MADLVTGTVCAQVRIRTTEGPLESEFVLTLGEGQMDLRFDPQVRDIVQGNPRLQPMRFHVGPPLVTLTLTGHTDDKAEDSWSEIPWDHGLEWDRVAALLQAATLFDAGDRDLADELASVALMWPKEPDRRVLARKALAELRAQGKRERG